MQHGELARQNFENGCNCAQSVLLAFSDLTGLDDAVAMRLASGLGGGMARLREVCGAVSGMFLAAGMLLGDSGTPDRAAKTDLYARLQALAAQFREENGSIICRELLRGVQTAPGNAPEARTASYYRKRPCAELCRSAADLLDALLSEQNESTD